MVTICCCVQEWYALLQALQQSSSKTSNARNVERCLDSGQENVLAVVAGIRKLAPPCCTRHAYATSIYHTALALTVAEYCCCLRVLLLSCTLLAKYGCLAIAHTPEVHVVHCKLYQHLQHSLEHPIHTVQHHSDSLHTSASMLNTLGMRVATVDLPWTVGNSVCFAYYKHSTSSPKAAWQALVTPCSGQNSNISYHISQVLIKPNSNSPQK